LPGERTNWPESKELAETFPQNGFCKIFGINGRRLCAFPFYFCQSGINALCVQYIRIIIFSFFNDCGKLILVAMVVCLQKDCELRHS
jgi:hypothetical protein